MPFGKGQGLGQGKGQEAGQRSGQGAGRGMGRGGGKGKMGGNRPSAGTGGYCICQNCKERVTHQAGVPCYSVSCPKCGANMVRE